MKGRFKLIVGLSTIALATVPFLTACNTLQGAGQDVAQVTRGPAPAPRTVYTEGGEKHYVDKHAKSHKKATRHHKTSSKKSAKSTASKKKATAPSSDTGSAPAPAAPTQTGAAPDTSTTTTPDTTTTGS